MDKSNKMLIDATHPGGDPGRGAPQRPGRGVRLRIGRAQAAARQHLSGQGDARRAVAAGGLRRLRRQPPRLPGLQRNPSRLLPDPGRRPAGAAAGGGGSGSRGRSRGRRPRRGRGGRARRATARRAPEPLQAPPQRRPARRAARGPARRCPRPRTRRAPARAGTARTRPRASAAGRRRAGAACRRAPHATPAATATATARRHAEADGNGHVEEIGGDQAEAPETVSTVEQVGSEDALEEVPERPAPAHALLQDPGGDQAPPDHPGAGRQGGARQQGRGAHHLPVAGRPLHRADAQHRARRRHLPQDHPAAGQEAPQGHRPRARGAGGHGAHHPHRRRRAHQAGDQARLRVRDPPVGERARHDAAVDRALPRLRGRQPHQALDPRPLLQGHRRDPGGRRGGPQGSRTTSCACCRPARPRTSSSTRRPSRCLPATRSSGS